MKKLILAVLVSVMLLPSMGRSASLLNVDLSVPNTITISASPGLSAATVSGSDFTGFYLENFFGGPVSTTLSFTAAGNLTSASNTSDGASALFHRNGDPGLNVFNTSTSSTLSFTAGAVAFSGSSTWIVSAADYALGLNGPKTGNVRFPADVVRGLASAALLGTYTVIPEPGTFMLFSMVMLGLFFARKRRIGSSQ